jgi:ComF family protein
VCPACSARLPWLDGPLCPHCGQPQASGILCPSCASRTSSIAAIRSVFRFEGVARVAVHELKYRNVRAIAPTLASYLVGYRMDGIFEPDVLVPVPMHPRRQRRRGYNQSELLARNLGRARGLPVDTSSLKRIDAGRSQVRAASSRERRLNVTEAFACAKASFSDKRVLLVDDVCTTGATLEACAVALRVAGAMQVVGLTVAREI